MKRILVIIALSLFLIANTAFAADLLGTWDVEGDCLRLGDPHVVGVKKTLGDPIVIIHQEDGLFEGYVCGVELPNARFFGAIDGREIHLTQWDAIVVGELNKKDLNKMSVVTQHQQFNPGASPATCFAEATKVSDLPTCCPIWPNAGTLVSEQDGSCWMGSCADNYWDCDGKEDNGCESEVACPESPSLPN